MYPLKKVYTIESNTINRLFDHRDFSPERLQPRDFSPERLQPRDFSPERLQPRDFSPERVQPRDSRPSWDKTARSGSVCLNQS